MSKDSQRANPYTETLQDPKPLQDPNKMTLAWNNQVQSNDGNDSTGQSDSNCIGSDGGGVAAGIDLSALRSKWSTYTGTNIGDSDDKDGRTQAVSTTMTGLFPGGTQANEHQQPAAGDVRHPAARRHLDPSGEI